MADHDKPPGQPSSAEPRPDEPSSAPRTAGSKSGDEHLADWAGLHMTETPEGFVGGWLKGMAGLARPLARAGISPNTITVAALGSAAAAVPLAAIRGRTGPATACVAVTVSGILDALDGAVAVQSGRATKVGFLLDSTLDRLADAALPAALAVAVATRRPSAAASAARWAVAASAGAWWLEYVRARGSLALPPERQVVTPGERPTRIVLSAVGLGLPSLALAALRGQVVIVGGSALYLFAWSLRRLRRHDLGQGDPSGNPTPPAPTARWPR